MSSRAKIYYPCAEMPPPLSVLAEMCVFNGGLKLNPEQIAAEYETVADKPTWFGSTIAFPRTIKL